MVPETLEPSLQLASAVLSQLNMPPDDVQEAIQEFRRAHMGELQVPSLRPSPSGTAYLLSESLSHARPCLCWCRAWRPLTSTEPRCCGGWLLQALCKTSGSTLGYGFPTIDLDDDDGMEEPAAPSLPLAGALPS